MKNKEKQREIILNEYDPHWVKMFQQEAVNIQEQLGVNCLDVLHIGSTAVPGLVAKPVIDILVVVKDISLVDSYNARLRKLDYIAMGEYGIPGRRFFYKSPEKRSFHLHVFAKGNAEIARHLAFRDYLCQNHNVAKAYGIIKQALAKQFPRDGEAYVLGKDSFIRNVDYRAGVAKQAQLAGLDNIELAAYDSRWPGFAAAEIEAIKNFVRLPYHSIDHLGSTAIHGMKAKPIIDLFIGLDDMHAVQNWIEPLQSLGYIYWQDNPNKQHARFFKGMPPYGITRTHHLHIMPVGEDLTKRIQFKNILQKSAELRNCYLQLKSELASKYADDREGYTREKSKFVVRVLNNYEDKK